MYPAPSRNAPSRDEMARFVARLEHLVHDEARTQTQRLHMQWSAPLARRVHEGKAIPALRLVALRRDGRLRFVCDHNESRFREGDILRLSLGDPFDADSALTVSLEGETDSELHVTITDREVNWGLFDRHPTGWLLDEGFLDLSRFSFEALRQVSTDTVGITRILPLLMGRAHSHFDPSAYDEGDAWAARAGLNPTQREAMAYAYATDLAYLIQGPPGTGKTHVLATLVAALVARGERVLVTSFTHRAINNALNKILRVAPEVPLAKIGPSHRADDLQRDDVAYEQFQESPLADEPAGYVVGATPFATRTSRLSEVQFDTIICDEASQVTLPLAIMAMLKGTETSRYIFIGDHRQMPPVLVTQGPDTAIRRSVFSALKGDLDTEDHSSTMLRVTYRLNDVLTEWPGARFYNRNLVSAYPQRRLHYPTPATRYQAILDPARPKVFVDLGHRDARTRSDVEADAVCALLQALLERGIPADEIGVVAPYRAQGRAIRARLRAAYSQTEIPERLVVDTVERMQGQERDVILLSLTTSLPSFAETLADFFFQPERLNVAITRPRHKLIIVGSRHVLEAAPASPEHQAAVDLFRDLIASCHPVTLTSID